MLNQMVRVLACFTLIAVYSTSALAAVDLSAGACSELQKQSARVVTQHSTTIAGKVINYSATVGFLEATASDGKSKACIFSTTYTVAPQDPAKPRPVLFAFNGGPGAASIWTHMGLLGPKRVDMGENGLTYSVPGKLVDNGYSILDVTDIVLIDPVSTGFSVPAGKATEDKFFGVKNDYMSIGSFIQNYLSEFNRWTSPKYILGESYGGMRGALLSHYLQSSLGISLNGVIFISPWFSTELTNFGAQDNELPYAYYLPTYATSAWYHHRIGSQYQSMDLKTLYQTALDFAETKYLPALLAGNTLSTEEFNRLASQLSLLTGLRPETISALNLRIKDSDFQMGLLAQDQNVVGAYDTRFIGPRLTYDTADTAIDPSDMSTGSNFIETINEYLRAELGFQIDSPYQPQAHTDPGADNWPYDNHGSEFNVIDDLNRALTYPSFRVFVASGYYDLVCPAGTVQFALGRLGRNLDVARRVKQSYFEGGHMMYINPHALSDLKAQLTQFIAGN